ncbi:MAG: hypothetical protein CML56_10305 [Rhodobacteraceae bacterium]|nr:hypothetical protein [Paracoccaceae bacterium]
MRNTKEDEKLNRHALVVAIWSPLIFVAAIALQIGIKFYNLTWIAAAFAIILIGFVCHLIVNAVLETEFTKGETALAAVCFTFVVIVFAAAGFISNNENVYLLILPMAVGFSSLIGAIIIYLLIMYGPRKSLEKFDVIRNNNARIASRLVHRGGRR